MTDTARRGSFSRAHKLGGPHGYTAVFAFKCWVSGDIFRVYAKPNGFAIARMGIVSGKRISRRAVDRNYCKRLVREMFRMEGRALGGLDLVVRPLVVVTPALAGAARTELRGLLLCAQRQCQGRAEANAP